MASNDTSNYREDVWNEVKDTFVGFERANDHTDPMNHILINTRDNQPFNLYIHGINVEGEIYHRQIKRDNSALDKVVEAGKTYCRTAKYAAEFKHLFEYGPYGVAVELAISKSNELIPDGNGGYTADDLIWVKFFQDENNPDKFILNLPDDDYKIRWFRNIMNFVGLRVYPDSRTVVLRRNPVHRSPAYSTVEPSDTFDTNLGDEVDVAAVFDRDEMTEEYHRCKYDGYVALVGRPAGNEEDRNINTSDYHSKIPADLVGSKYHGRNSDWAGNIGNLIITGYPIKAFSYGVRLYPVENADNSIDYYPFKIYPGVPELYRYRDKIFDKMTISMNLDSDFESPVFGSLNPNDIKMPRYLLLSDLFNALAEKIRTIRGENAAARRETLLRRNFERAGWETNENNFLWTIVKNWFNSDAVDIRPMSFSDLIGNDLNNISHAPHIASERYQPYLLKLKDGTVKLEKTKRWYAQQLIKAINGRIGWITSSELIDGYRAGLNNLFVKEISGLSSASGATLSYPLMTTSTLDLDIDSGSLINRITPVQRPTRPSNDAPRADGGELPSDIEVRYLENKYLISNGQFMIPNNDLPVHEKQVSLKVSYTDDPSDVGSVVNNVTLPAHYPHEFRIEKLNRDFTTGAVTYRVRLASLNRIDEDISVYHEDVEFNTSRANDESDDVEFTIPNSLLPENDEIWEIEVRYPHFGETVTSRVRGVEVEARLIESKPDLFTRDDGEPNGTVTIKPREDDRPSGTSSIPYRPKESSPADSTDTRVHQSPPPNNHHS